MSSLKKWKNFSRKQSNKPKCPPSTIAFKTPGSPPPNLETRGEKSTHCQTDIITNLVTKATLTFHQKLSQDPLQREQLHQYPPEQRKSQTV